MRKSALWRTPATWLGLVLLLLTALAVAKAPMIGSAGNDLVSDEVPYVWQQLRLWSILVGGFLASFCLMPLLESRLAALRSRWKPFLEPLVLGACCLFLSAFIIWFGRWQFGAFDFDILIDIGWRQISGQRPYVDFVTSTPPGFNLGALYAFRLFGINWDANLYFSALFCCITFLWMYALLVRLSMSRASALLTSFAIQCAAMLTLCFWWYNNSALVLAAVFYLSSLVYARGSRSWLASGSYVVSLGLLALMKPNVAGLTIVGCVLLLLLIVDRRLKLILLTAAALALSIALLLIHHVSPTAMLASYLEASKERGGFNAFGLGEMNLYHQVTSVGWICILSIPLLAMRRPVMATLARRDVKGFLYLLFFPLALAVALYGVATNGEFRDVECTLTIAAGAVLLFCRQSYPNPLLRRVYLALLCASIAGDLYVGAVRMRVFTIGMDTFFEWTDNRESVDDDFFRHMRVSATMVEVEREVRQARETNPGPYFFGPRMDFNYAALALPSPTHLPLWWHPGTAFGKDQEPHLVQVWRDHHFQTLIFLTGEYIYYPQELLDAIAHDYQRDDSYDLITVYRRRAP